MPKINLQTPSSRARLAPRGRPYQTRLIPGVHLAYRAAQTGTGAWIVIAADGRGGQWTKRFAVADDKQKPDGVAVLSYEQAASKARLLARGDANAAADRPVSISEALDAYENDLVGRGRRPYNAAWVRKHLPQHLAQQPLSTVSVKMLRAWRDSLIRTDLTPASITKIGKASMAAFNLAARLDPRIHANSQAWRVDLEALPHAVQSRDAVLGDASVIAVVAATFAISEAFGVFVQAHAETGARSSQLARCLVGDLVGDKLMVPASRKGRNGGRGGHVAVPLTPALAARLAEAARGRSASEPLLLSEAAEAWRDGEHKRPFAKAARVAGLPEGSTIYALRHSSIARMLLRGLPIRLVAELHDTSSTIIEKHYGRFIARHGDDLIRTALIDTTPQQPLTKVVKLRS